jgi:hypothetical protein
MKKILYIFLFLFINTTTYSLEKYTREIRLKCEVTKTDLITDKDDSRFAFAEQKITPFIKTFNIYILIIIRERIHFYNIL